MKHLPSRYAIWCSLLSLLLTACASSDSAAKQEQNQLDAEKQFQTLINQTVVPAVRDVLSGPTD